MMSDTVSVWLSLLLVFVAAPLVPGVATRTKAMLAGRRGAPVWQLYADLWKLLRRGVVYSDVVTGAFRVAPVAVLATTVIAATLLPLGGRASVLRFGGDAIAFACLLATGRFALILGAFDTGSSFEAMGASRDATFAALVEPGLFLVFAGLGVAAGSLTLTSMLGPHAMPLTGAAPASVLFAAAVFALALAECARVPVDDPTTHLELTMVHEVMVLDHSGPDLAMILYANALKLALFAAVLVGVAAPDRGASGVAGVLALLGALMVVGIAVGIVESITARLRLPRVPLFIAGGNALALFGLVLLVR